MPNLWYVIYVMSKNSERIVPMVNFEFFFKEYLSEKNDASLILFGCSSKKRPNSLIMARTFDKEIIDMFEFGLESVKFMDEFKVIFVRLKQILEKLIIIYFI